MNKRQRQAVAWLVHLYTVSGGIVAMFGLFEAAKGNTIDAFLLIIVSRIIDATDGLIARKLRTWEVLPNFSGDMVDNLIDIFTFLWIPVYIMWSEQVLPHDIWLIVPVIATLYAYGNINMKTEDGFFMGFPSLWGMILIYLYFLNPGGWIAVLIVVIPAIMSFMPIKFLYATKYPFLRTPTLATGGLYILLWLYILLEEPENIDLVYLSLFFPVYYLLASLYATYKFRPNAQPAT